jgi:hypothetical protein
MRKFAVLVFFALLAFAADGRIPHGGAFNGQAPAGTPIGSPASGPYPTTQSFTLANPSSPTPTAQICYTTDLSQPTCPVSGTSQVYTGGISVTTTTTFKYVAGNVVGFTQSNTGTTTITIETQTATPMFLPANGPYSDVGFSFTLSCAAGATPYYTTDGTTPTYPATGTTTLYTGAVSLPQTPGLVTPMALCEAPGFTNSGVITASYTLTGSGPSGACETGVTAGTLNLVGTVTRTTGSSPLMVVFDMTGTTDPGVSATSTPFLDVTYSYTFGDPGASGTGTWPYGSNAGGNSKNTAVGGVAAHLYVVPYGTGDITPQVTVNAQSTSGNNASCTFNLTVYDNADASPQGFAGASTVCVSSSGTPVAGSGGCPAGAGVLNSATFGGALPTAMSGLQYLFKCGDTFTYSSKTLHGNRFRIDEYGACTGSNRPIIQRPQSGDLLTIGNGPVQTSDGAVSNLDCEGTGTFNNSSSGGCFFNGQDSAPHVYPTQITWYNNLSNNNAITFQDYIGSQIGLFQNVMNGMGFVGGDQGIFINESGNQCTNGSSAYNCGGSGAFDNINYNVLYGNHFDGLGAFGSSSGPETVRVSACRMCVIEQNDMLNATQSTAVLKLHDDFHSSGTFGGQYMELSVISDNYFSAPLVTACSAQLVEITPENAVTDERNRNLLIERNLFAANCGGVKGLALSVVNARLSDNMFTSGSGVAIQKRGVEYTNTSGAPVNTLAPELVEGYNNSCYNSNPCMWSTAWGPAGNAGNDNTFVNTLAYNASGGSVISVGGTGNTVSNNTATITCNPGFANHSGHFHSSSDFNPTACTGGGTPSAVPVIFDALNNPFATPYPLGAVIPSVAPVTSFKFFAGNAALSLQYQHNVSLGQCQTDVNALAASPVPGGNSAQMYVPGWRWPSLENGPPNNLLSDAQNGTGQFAGFQQIYQCYTYLQATIPGAHFGISVMGDAAGATDSYTASIITTRPWNTTGLIVPGDIASGGCPSNCGHIVVPNSFGSSSSTTYAIAPMFAGPGPNNGHAYYGIGFNGCDAGGCSEAIPAFWIPPVNQRYINLWQALSFFTYQAPSGHPLCNPVCPMLTLDTDPLVSYIFSNDEYSYNLTVSPTGAAVNPPQSTGSADLPSNTNMFAADRAWATAATGFFPHTLIGNNFTFGFGAGHGTDTPANMAAYTNQNIAAGALSTIQGLALTASDTYGNNFAAGSTDSGMSCALQGYIGYASPGCFTSGLGTGLTTSLIDYMPLVSQIQPFDYLHGLPSGVHCTSPYTLALCTGAITSISAAANNSYIHSNLLIWSMGDAVGSTTTSAWSTYVQPTIIHAAGTAGVTPYSTIRPSNLPGGVTTWLTMPSYTDLYGNTYVSGVAAGPVRGQTGSAPKNIPPGAVYPLAERANPYAGAGNDTYYWPNTWAGAGTMTGFAPTNAAGKSQLSIQPQGTSPTTTFQMEGPRFGAYMLGSDAYTSSGRPQFTLQQNFFDNPVSGSPSPGPVLFTGPSVTLYNSITLEARTYVPAASAPDTTNSPYIQLGTGFIPNPVPSPRSWELDIFVTMLAGASENQAVHSFFITQGPPDAYVLVLPFAKAGTGTYATFTSGTYQTGTFGPTNFSWSISYSQMKAIIAYMIAQGYTAFNGLVPENFTLFQTHINAEQPNSSTISMGWNATNWSITAR